MLSIHAPHADIFADAGYLKLQKMIYEDLKLNYHAISGFVLSTTAVARYISFSFYRRFVCSNVPVLTFWGLGLKKKKRILTLH